MGLGLVALGLVALGLAALGLAALGLAALGLVAWDLAYAAFLSDKVPPDLGLDAAALGLLSLLICIGLGLGLGLYAEALGLAAGDLAAWDLAYAAFLSDKVPPDLGLGLAFLALAILAMLNAITKSSSYRKVDCELEEVVILEKE